MGAILLPVMYVGKIMELFSDGGFIVSFSGFLLGVDSFTFLCKREVLGGEAWHSFLNLYEIINFLNLFGTGEAFY